MAPSQASPDCVDPCAVYLRGLIAQAPGGAGLGVPALALRTRTPRPRAARGAGLVPLAAVVAEQPRVLLEGEAGAGKTTFLRALAADLAAGALADPAAPVPALAPARALVEHAAAADSPADALPAALAAAGDLALAWWRAQLSRPTVVLLDRLDEIEGAARDRLIAILAGALDTWRNARVVIASRPGTSDDVRALGLRRIAIEPLDLDAAAAWVASTSAAAAAALAATPALAGLCTTPRAAEQLAVTLAAGVTLAPTAAALAHAVVARDPAAADPALIALVAELGAGDGTAPDALAARLAPLLHDPRRGAALGALLPWLAVDAPARAARVLDAALARADDPATPPADRAAWIGLVGRPWPDLAAALTAPRAARYRRALATVLDLVASAPPIACLAALEALGRAGDPRLGDAPVLAAVPGHPALEVGRYPVTVADYARFLDDGGYHEPRWWGDGWAERVAAAWCAPGSWTAQRRAPNRPVVEVSWYEARAYAAWLAARTGRPLALVSSAAWQAAATHPEGPHPWGAAPPDRTRLNFDQHVGRATPVGLYAAGASPGGHLDLVGNVWEWCRDRGDGDGDTRIVRGAGWFSAGTYARADYQYGFHPANRFHDLGLRVAVAPAIAPAEDA
jgi:Sulfatase-modifying factor enzyme 1/NACHT domain